MKPFKKSPLNLNPGKNANLPRNSFDLGYHSIFTSPAGMLLPSYVQDVQAGDFLSLDVKNFTRTMPVNTAAFSRLKEVTDFYFVPYRLLWRQFNQFITGVSDIDTSYLPDGTNVPTSVPSISISDLINLLNPAGTVLNDMHGFRNIANIERLLDLLGYPVSNDSNISTYQMYLNMRDAATNKSLPTPTFNPFRLLAYQKIFFDYYRNSDYTANNPNCYNIDKCASGTTVTGVNLITDVRYAQWKKDRLTSVKPSPLAVFSNSNASIIPQNGEGLNRCEPIFFPLCISNIGN